MSRYLVFLFMGLSACSAARKISHIEVRKPASQSEQRSISSLRAGVLASRPPVAPCPREIRELFLPLAAQRIEFPECPQALQDSFQASLLFLNIEERSVLEEALNSQCRSVEEGNVEEPLETLYENFDSTGPLGRRKGSGEISATDLALLERLRAGLQELLTVHLPLGRWVRRNGDYLFSDEELTHFKHLFLKRSCRVEAQDIDQSYSSIRALEALTRALREGGQQNQVERFLNGLQTLTDKKIGEFF